MKDKISGFGTIYYLGRILQEIKDLRRDTRKGTERLVNSIYKLEGKIMATKDDVLAAIAQEKQEVTDKLTELFAEIQALKDQIAGGGVVTAEDLDAIVAGINGIFVKE